jgi:anti-sigma regulatory factor (Ser/Thr protein kinase)
MYLPDEFGGADEDNIYSRLTTIEEVMEQSERARQFCLEHGVDKKKAGYCALFIEEMGGNIILHGKPKEDIGEKEKPAADYRLFVSGGRISITLRDFCKLFDPQKYIEQEHEDGKGIGIKMVYKLASETKYFNAFNSNNMIILLEYDK